MEDINNSIKKNHSVTAAVSVALLLCILLVLSGIWNSRNTAELAKSSLTQAIDVRQLGSALEKHHHDMSKSVELAVTKDDSYWRIHHHQNNRDLYKILDNPSLPAPKDIVANLRQRFDEVIALENQIFDLLEAGNIDQAFSILTSDNYQEKKIEQERLSLTFRARLDKEAKQSIEALNKKLNTATLAMSLQIALLIAIWLYITAVVRRWQHVQNQHSDELAKLAHYDSLTGIGNRTLFQMRLEAAFQQSRRDGKLVGLLLMDLDHFKDINDSLGHDAGDQLLKEIAKRVQHNCRASDTVVRLGGDEFAIIVSNLNEKSDAAVLGNKILSIFEQPLQLQDREIKTGTSIGLAFYPEDAESADELLRKTDMALYEAKHAGRGSYKFFDRAIETEAREKVAMQEDLRTALKREQFELYYQPVVCMETGHTISVECLLRWRHPHKGFISPADFIPIAEESRLIVPIGEWVLRTACSQQVAWQRRGLPPVKIAVNLSGVQFNEHNILEVIQNILDESNIQRDSLTIEITESTLMQTEGDLLAKLHALNALGLTLAIDDFGTGYSSLAYLRRFPIHHLKIDREFVKELPHNTQDGAIARSIIKMAHELNIKVVAEGIENTLQYNFLYESGCNYGQGYYFSKPMPAADLAEWLIATQPAQRKVNAI